MERLLDRSQWSGLRERVVEHLSTPLYRNGYALIAGSVFTSGIGFFYWVIAARLYPAEIFGINATLISTMTFLSNTANLNMGNLLVRFIPGAGKRLPRIVFIIYAISMTVAVVATVGFLLVQPIWASKLSMLQSDPLFGAWFVVSTSLWCIFVLQDNALTGLRQAMWVPLENLIFALAKVGLLFLLVAYAPVKGIFWSWSIPVIVVVPAITYLLFGRLIPAQVKDRPETTTELTFRKGARFAGNDFLGSLIGQAVGSLLPLFVLAKLGAPQAGYLSVALMISTSLSLVTSNIGSSLLAESAADESKLADYSYRALLHALRLLVPAVVLITLGAPLLLAMFGKSFSEEATFLLRLMCLSALPATINTLRSNILRVKMRTNAIVVQILVINGITVAIAFMLVDRFGIASIGVASLAGQGIVALVILLTDMRPLWLGRLNLSALVAVRQDVRARMSGRGREVRRLVETHLPEVLDEVQSQSGLKNVAGWQLRGSLGVDAATLAYQLGSQSQTEAMLKLAVTPELIESLNQQRQVVQDIWANPSLNAWRSIVPRVLAHGTLDRAEYVVETMLPGINGVEALAKGASGDRLLRNASAAIKPLHAQTAHTVTVDDAVLSEWVSRRADIVRAALSRGIVRGALPSLEKLSGSLCDTLSGRTINASWIHGDYVPGNVLLDPKSLHMTGIVDWELAERSVPPQIELMWLIMSTRLHSQRRELGHVIVNILNDREEGLTDLEREVLASEGDEGSAGLPLRELVAMAWLFHVSSNLGKEMERYSNNWLWMFKNVESVLYFL